MAVTAKETRPLKAYSRHIISDNLRHRHPYLEDIKDNLKSDDVSMAFGDRCFPRLVEQLKTPTLAPEKLSEALQTICDLSAHQENKCIAIASDVVAAATNLLMHQSVDVQRDAARVIASLAHMICGRMCMPLGNRHMPKNLTGALLDGPTLPRLAKLLRTVPGDEIVKMNVARAIHFVCIYRDGCQQVVDHGTVKATANYLCVTLPDLPPTQPLAMCVLFLLRALAAVTMYARDAKRGAESGLFLTQDVLGCGLIQKIVQFLAKVPMDSGIPALEQEDSTELVRQALRVLWHVGNDPTGRKEMLKADAVSVVTRFLADQDSKNRETAVCVLSVIALETPGKKEILKCSKEALATLLHNKETAFLHETCVQLCRCVAELPAFRFAFARHILKSIWLLEKIFGTPTLAAVSPLLAPEEDAETRAQAAQVVLHFLGTTSEGDILRVPPVCPMQHILEPANFAMEECVGIMRNLLGLLHFAADPALACIQAMLVSAKAQRELKELLAMDPPVVPTLPSHVQSSLNAMLAEAK
jgi:hypothetical protein